MATQQLLPPPYQPPTHWNHLTSHQKWRLGSRKLQEYRACSQSLRTGQMDVEGLFLLFDRALKMLNRSPDNLRDVRMEVLTGDILGYDSNDTTIIEMSDHQFLNWYLLDHLSTDSPDQEVADFKKDWRCYAVYQKELNGGHNAFQSVSVVTSLMQNLDLGGFGFGLLQIQTVATEILAERLEEASEQIDTYKIQIDSIRAAWRATQKTLQDVRKILVIKQRELTEVEKDVASVQRNLNSAREINTSLESLFEATVNLARKWSEDETIDIKLRLEAVSIEKKIVGLQYMITRGEKKGREDCSNEMETLISQLSKLGAKIDLPKNSWAFPAVVVASIAFHAFAALSN